MSNFGVMLEKFGNDWRVLETAMCRHLNSEIALISEIGIRQLTGGKKLRALISLLSRSPVRIASRTKRKNGVGR